MSDDSQNPKVGTLALGAKLGEVDGTGVFALNDPRYSATVVFVSQLGPQAGALFAAGKRESEAGNGIECHDFGLGDGCAYLLARPTDTQLAELLAGKRRLGQP